jgi:hypothetical protein
MSQDTLDPRHEQLIAALYGELTAEEEAAFHQRLLTDADLRAEWEELRETRSVLGDWTVDEDTAPSFVFLDPEETPPPARTGFGERLLALFRGPAWGLAAAAAMAVLVFAGFRVDHLNGGLVFRFGPAPASLVMSDGRQVAGATSLDVAPGQTSVPGQAAGALPDAYPAGAGAESPVVLRAVSAMLNDYQEQRNAELAYILRGMVDELRAERAREMDDLKARVDVVGMLMAEQNRSNARIRTLIDRGEGTRNPAPLNPDEDN